MIVPMQRVTILCTEADRDTAIGRPSISQLIEASSGPLRMRVMISPVCRLSESPSLARMSVSRGASLSLAPISIRMLSDPTTLETICRCS